MEDLIKPFESILKLSPPLVLAIVINFLLLFCKRIPYVPNWSLPLIATILGAIAYPQIADVANVSYSVKNPDAFNVIMGCCIGGSAVAIHQTFKQILSRFFGYKSDTEILVKSSDTQE